MKLAVIGTGYVGLVSGVCFAQKGNEVICVDLEQHKIDMLNRAESPIYEPGIEELIALNLEAGRLEFTSDLADAVRRSDIVILAVGTPSLANGEANLSYIEQAAADVGKAMNGYKIIMTKSTVPVGTNEKIKDVLARHTSFLSISSPRRSS